MKFLVLAVTIFETSLVLAADAPILSKLQSEMARLGVSTAVVMPAASIDDYPILSLDGRYLYANMAPQGWWKVDLNAVVLGEAQYREKLIGIIQKGSTVAPAADDEVEKVRKASPPLEEKLVLKNGTRIQWEQQGALGMKLLRQVPGKSPDTLWETDMAVCGYLVSSPDEALFVTYCEGVGFIAMQAK